MSWKRTATSLTAPPTIVVVCAVALASAYAWVLLQPPEGVGLSFGLSVFAVAAGLTFMGERAERRRLSSLTALARGASPERPLLVAVAREVVTHADFTFLEVLLLVSGGGSAAGLVWWATSAVSGWDALRLAFLGAALAPLTASLAHVAVLPRARQILVELTQVGLGLDGLREAIPPRYDLKRRLLIFAASATLTPMLLIADLALGRLLLTLRAMDGAVAGAAGAAADQVSEQGLGLIVGVTVGLLVLVMVSAQWIGRALGTPLVGLARETGRLVRGNYRGGAIVIAEGETWAAALALAGLEQHLRGVLEQVQVAAGGIGQACTELADNGRAHEAGAREQTASIAATGATAEELAKSARHIAQGATQVSSLAHDTLDMAKAGDRDAQAFTRAMVDVRLGNQAIADSVVRLNKRVQQVGRIIDFINEIADRSDLLALNAELEGYKAGDVGEGFGLVAAEMRRLAESVMDSTREIGRLLEEIRDATNAAVMATEAGVKATDAGAALAQQVSGKLGAIVEFANTSADAMQAISLATNQQQQGTDQLVAAMAEVLSSTRASAEAAKVVSETEAALVQVAQELADSVRELEAKP